ncbi:hypothetical protein [Candidatus Endoriftia persephone]|jgi:hypothetical protein|uniref:Uncharacterized protein n=2 Tax=sulfur-oxidizing symbionts TaxID=32036 RepID=G2FDH4_9GAMM|nr:hypothetical protein [Candidatus Endoriftia persephone]EGV51530.1 hypothetical protein Rifp1Sym_bf00030 [endosymbiont of Riftia pachyptila (vent Ph05)]EGW55260.1 hypothetical protein TevJSym_ae01170 [endosymbiont of Tevnia jerichonana (vent Tica)]
MKEWNVRDLVAIASFGPAFNRQYTLVLGEFDERLNVAVADSRY